MVVLLCYQVEADIYTWVVLLCCQLEAAITELFCSAAKQRQLYLDGSALPPGRGRITWVVLHCC